MDKGIRYTLGRNERLKSRKAIEQLFKEGKSFSIFPFRVLYLFKDEAGNTIGKQPPMAISPLCAGFTVSSRNFKRAVDRNRVRRLLKESYRHQKNELQGIQQSGRYSLSIFFIYIGKEIPVYDWLYEKTGLVLKRLIKLTSENSQ